jgi:hypothetical protein
MQQPESLHRNWVKDLEKEIIFAHDPTTTDAERIQDIIESKYCPADLEKIVEKCSHLQKEEQHQLLLLLKKIKILFNGTLGTGTLNPTQRS